MYINEMISERKAEYQNDPNRTARGSDLLTNLIAAAMEDEGDVNENIYQDNKHDIPLTERELRGYVSSDARFNSITNVERYIGISSFTFSLAMRFV
jgi:hypothetical protein